MRGLEIWEGRIGCRRVNGHCNGGGLEQALSCDIRIVNNNAQFGLGEVPLGRSPAVEEHNAFRHDSARACLVDVV